MSNAMSCGQATLALLEAYGIETVFGIPGVHTIELYRGLKQRRIDHVLVRHEQGAGFMADGYARASGKPAACLLITGPGLTNAATPIAQAYSDSQPMLVIASTNQRRELGKAWGPFHEVPNQRLIADQFTAFAGTALSAADVPEMIAQAWSLMTSGRPRPVYVEIPRDVLAEPVEETWPAVTAGRPGRPRPEDLARAADLLAGARQPLILVGGGACDAAPQVTRLAERLSAPVLSSFAGKGIIADSNPLSLGARLGMPKMRAAVAAADVVVAIGTELSTVDSSNQRLFFSGPLIRIDADARKMNDLYPAAVGLIADAALAVEDLLDALPQAPASAAAEREAVLSRLSPLKAAAQDFGATATPQHRKLLAVLRRVLPDDGIVVSDMTQLAYSGNHCFPCEQPRTWIHPACYATLGYGLPAAIGAKLGRPEAKVVALSGDCGFLFTNQEMATAAERRLQVVQILWNNEALGEIRDGMAQSGIEPVEVVAENPDYIALARAFRWTAERAASLSHLEALLTAAFEHDGPTLIEVREGAGDWA